MCVCMCVCVCCVCVYVRVLGIRLIHLFRKFPVLIDPVLDLIDTISNQLLQSFEEYFKKTEAGIFFLSFFSILLFT
jgi:hypothetical protein